MTTGFCAQISRLVLCQSMTLFILVISAASNNRSRCLSQRRLICTSHLRASASATRCGPSNPSAHQTSSSQEPALQRQIQSIKQWLALVIVLRVSLVYCYCQDQLSLAWHNSCLEEPLSFWGHRLPCLPVHCWSRCVLPWLPWLPWLSALCRLWSGWLLSLLVAATMRRLACPSCSEETKASIPLPRTEAFATR